jgi:hypothetical protein
MAMNSSSMQTSVDVRTDDAAGIEVTDFERFSDALIGLAFLTTAIIAAKRMSWSRQQGGVETTVVTAFYSLILLTSSLRAVWFLVPNSVWTPSYTPLACFAFDPNHPSWLGSFMSEVVLTAGSLGLFSIFILILVYWADILKKYFYPGARRSRPMMTFFALVTLLVVLEILNALLFLTKVYSSEAMILFNALLLATVSIICVVEITIFSHRFRTVLKTLGAINQVSTESQVKRIVWITVTGNLFFAGRALLETIFAVLLMVYWHKYGNVEKVFSHKMWDSYVLLKHWSEVAILGLMLYILQSRFTAAAARAGDGYEAVPDAEPSVTQVPKANTAIIV